MRILALPHYTNRNINGCTTYIYFKYVMTTIVRQRDDVYFYLPVPNDTFEDTDLSEIHHERIEIIPMDMLSKSTDHIHGLLHIPPSVLDLFNDLNGKHHIDAVLCTSIPYIATLKGLMSSVRNSYSFPPIYVNCVMYALDSSEAPLAYVHSQCAGLLSSDINIFQSSYSKRRLFKSVKPILSSSARADILKKTSKSTITSVPLDDVLSVEIQPKAKEKWILNYGYAMNSKYNFRDVFAIFDYLFCSGMDIEVLINTSSIRMGRSGKEFGDLFDSRYSKYFNITHALPQKQFWKRISSAHAFLFLATDAESSFSVIEQHILGLVGVYIDSDYAREITFDGYPYICKNKEELTTTLRYVCENYHQDDVQEVIERQKKYLFDKVDMKKNALIIIDEIENIIKSRQKDTKGVKEMIIDALEDLGNPTHITSVELASAIKRTSRNRLDYNDGFNWNQGTLRSKFIEQLRLLGWKDTCQKEYAFKRTENEND